ncbi:MAG TPA: hypothetical protein VIJ28_02470 [Chloroflexota bacterium]|jgi:hypothetical protein
MVRDEVQALRRAAVELDLMTRQLESPNPAEQTRAIWEIAASLPDYPGLPSILDHLASWQEIYERGDLGSGWMLQACAAQLRRDAGE